MTLTDYSRDAGQDRRLLDVLKRSYRNVYLWLQGAGDYEYLTSIAGADEVRILPSGLAAYDELLNDRTFRWITWARGCTAAFGPCSTSGGA